MFESINLTRYVAEQSFYEPIMYKLYLYAQKDGKVSPSHPHYVDAMGANRTQSW